MIKPKILTLIDGTKCCDQFCPYYFLPTLYGAPLCRIDYKDVKKVDELLETYHAHCFKPNFMIQLHYKLNQKTINVYSCDMCGELLNYSANTCEYCGYEFCPF